MIDLSTLSTLLGVSGSIGIVIASIGYTYAQLKAGGNKYKDDTIDSLKESLAISEEKNKHLSEEKNQLIVSHQEQITKLVKELGELKGRFDESTKLAEEYKLILQGRGPDDVTYKAEVRGFMLEVAKYMESSSKVFAILEEKRGRQQKIKKAV